MSGKRTQDGIFNIFPTLLSDLLLWLRVSGLCFQRREDLKTDSAYICSLQHIFSLRVLEGISGWGDFKQAYRQIMSSEYPHPWRDILQPIYRSSAFYQLSSLRRDCLQLTRVHVRGG